MLLKKKKRKLNRPKCYVWPLGLRLLPPCPAPPTPNFSEERVFLRVDWGYSFTFGNFNWHLLLLVYNGSWSWCLEVGDMQSCGPGNLGALLCFGAECQGETGPGGELPSPLQRYWVAGCQKPRQGLLPSQFPALSREEGTREREGDSLFFLTWIGSDVGPLVWRNSIVQSVTVLTLEARSTFRVTYKPRN